MLNAQQKITGYKNRMQELNLIENFDTLRHRQLFHLNIKRRCTNRHSIVTVI